MNLPPPPPPAIARGHDANVGIEDWAQLDAILDAWPDPNLPQIFDGLRERAARASSGRYVLMTWWFCLYERLWSLRGMENVLCDFYENPRPLHRLMDAMTDFYCAILRRAAKELSPQGAFTSDDIGMQTGPMFSPEIFREFFKPRYAKIFRTAHECGMHFWLHTCGNVLPFLDELIEIGLDVIHPIQKYTMDEREVARRFGGRICFWAGMDVQRILPRGTPDEVRREVRFMIDTYDRPDGGCMMTAGNGITPDVPLENLRAFYDEAYTCGLSYRNRAGD
jgi:uroporphyrinogen-III decarboxylase